VGGEDAKAVQVGGASGQCVPRALFGNKIAYESSPPGGSIVVFGPHRDMLDVAENFMEFFCEESCGQCIPCRKGTRVLLDGIRLLKQGACSVDHLERLKRLGATITVASKCGLGQGSPNIFNAMTEHFRDEILGRQS
jgi:[NiFe] hydrogenase diaphorase moiety large subunit